MMKSLVALILVSLSVSLEAQDLEIDAIKNLFITGKYNNYVKPRGTNASADHLVVKVNLHVLSLDNIRTDESSFDLQMYFREEWTDSRLKFNDQQGILNQISLNDVHTIWTPDLFFVNEKSGQIHNLMKTNNFIRISPNGTVKISSRISQTFNCPMDLRSFPFDEQVCSVLIESYGYKFDELELQWESSNPVSYSTEWRIPEFTLRQINTDVARITVNSGSTYGRLTLDFVLKRQPHSYILHVYIPTTMVVLLSYLTFFIRPNRSSARSVLVSLPLFMLLILNITNTDVLPKLPYTTAMDVWNGVCITFAFLALVEFVFVHFSESDEDSEDKKELYKEKETESQTYKLLINKLKNRNYKADYIFRILYPILFIVFNIIYWSVYL